MKNKGLLLDRDGVININHGYVYEKKNCQFIEGIFDLARLAISKNFIICIITNQAGIGRGYYSEKQFHDFMDWMSIQFKNEGAFISKVFYSPYHPVHGKGIYKKDDNSRKPNPGMLLQAIKEFDLDPDKSILIGDSVSDIQAGIAAGIGTNLYLGESEMINKLDSHLYNKISSLSDGNVFLENKNL